MNQSRFDSARIIRARAGFAFVQKLADRGRDADAHEQPRSGVAERRRNSSSTAASAVPHATGNALTQIVRSAQAARSDETLLVQSGKPVGVFPTHPDALACSIANSRPRTPMGDVGALPRVRTAKA